MTVYTSDMLPAAVGEACVARQARLRTAMSDAGVDALLLSTPRDIRYLTGFIGDESLAMVLPDGAAILSDGRYDEYLDPWRGTPVAEIVMGTRHRLNESVRDLCRQRNLRRLGIQAEHVSIIERAKIAATVGADTIVDTDGLVARLRVIKDDVELATIERACVIHQDAMTATLGQLRIGMTEREACALLEFEMKRRGADAASFPPMVCAGANSSIMHYTTGDAPLEPGVVLFDWGATVAGYNSDMTRTVGLGRLPEKIREIYAIVLDAQLAAIDAIAPGLTCASIDAVARHVITRAGYGEYFGHGLGHGLGLEVHEGPYFNNLSTDIRLEPGMVMTVEPGIYLPGVGGVRIEDDIVVTESGCRLLSDYPKRLDEAIIDPQTTGA